MNRNWYFNVNTKFKWSRPRENFYQEHITSAPKQLNISCDCLIVVALLQLKQHVKLMFMNNVVLLVIIWNKQNKAFEEIDLLLYRQKCLIWKYTTSKVHTKSHPEAKWCIFHISTTCISPLITGRFWQKCIFWTFWTFSVWIGAKVVPVYSKRHLTACLFLPFLFLLFLFFLLHLFTFVWVASSSRIPKKASSRP